MIRAILCLLVLMVPAAASATDRTLGVGSFDRLRVDGPFRVTVATGSPRATISGDSRTVEQVEVRADGNTLVVRMGGNGWGEQPAARGAPVSITLSTPSLVSAAVFGAAEVKVARMKGPRVDLSVAGTGVIALASADTEQLNATVIGSGSVTIGGRTGKARLLSNGAGSIDATTLAADEITVRLDGPGEIKGQARYAAQVVNTGLGRVAVVGNAKCSIKADAGGPVSCGPKL